MTRDITLTELRERVQEIEYQLKLRGVEMPGTESAIDELMHQRSIPVPEPYSVHCDEAANPFLLLQVAFGMPGRVLAKLEVLFAEELNSPSIYDGPVTNDMLEKLKDRFRVTPLR